MKKLIRIIIGLVIVCILIIIYISYLTDANDKETSKLLKEIKQKYHLSEEITYANEYNNIYIIKTTSKVIVLSKNFKEIKTEELSKLKEDKEGKELIYKTNKLMYEKTIRKKDKVTYEYYDALSGELIKTTKLELK